MKNPKRIIVCDLDEQRLQFVREHYPEVLTTGPQDLHSYVLKDIAEAYDLFENRRDGVIKVAIKMS